MNSIQVSFIIPVYNNEQFLPSCLDSIINQSIENIEIICINDCSTDNSQEILDSYSAKDSRFKLISYDKNQGPGAARNAGLSLATGKYLRMVDSDDFIPFDSTEKLFETAERYSSNFVRGGYCSCSKNGEKLKKGLDYPSKISINTSIWEDKSLWQVGQHWAYLYKTEFLLATGVQYEESMRNGQDAAFKIDLMPYLEKVTIIPETVYFYRNNPASTTRKRRDKAFFLNVLSIYDRAYDSLPSKGLQEVADYIFYYSLWRYFPNEIFPTISKDLKYEDAEEIVFLLKQLFQHLEAKDLLFSNHYTWQGSMSIPVEINYISLLLQNNYFLETYNNLNTYQQRVRKERTLQKQLKKTQRHLDNILNSSTWKITTPARHLFNKPKMKKLGRHIKQSTNYSRQFLHHYLTKHLTKTTIDIKICTPRDKNSHLWGDTHFAESFSAALQAEGFNTTIHLLQEWDSPKNKKADIVIHLRGLVTYTPKPNAVNILWIISHPDDISIKECMSYDIILVASSLFAKKLRAKINIPVHTFLQATDPDRFKPATADKTFQSDILFVGNTRNQLRPCITWASELDHDLHVYGTGWTKQNIPANMIKGKYFPNENLNLLYSSTAIILNDHYADMKEHGFISNRLFDALATQSFIISDNVPGVDETFHGSVPTYQSKEDFKKLINLFLDNKHKREELATLGKKIVLEEHTFTIRAKHLKRILAKHKYKK